MNKHNLKLASKVVKSDWEITISLVFIRDTLCRLPVVFFIPQNYLQMDTLQSEWHWHCFPITNIHWRYICQCSPLSHRHVWEWDWTAWGLQCHLAFRHESGLLSVEVRPQFHCQESRWKKGQDCQQQQSLNFRHHVF